MKKVFLLMLIVLSSLVMIAKENKSVSILGDSYSTFEGYLMPDTNFVWYKDAVMKHNDVSDVKQTWWYQFIKEGGYKMCVNNSFSGSTICNTGYKGEDYSQRSFCKRLVNLGCPDIILIFGATNDSWAKAPIGQFKYDQWTAADLYQFRPAMAYMLDKVMCHYPNVDVYFILNNELSADVTQSCKDICKHYGVKCIQLEGIDKMSGHPSVKGMRQIADQVKAVVK